MIIPLPKHVPKLGFYYDFLHDPARGLTDHAQEVIGVGFLTKATRIGEEHSVIFRPLNCHALEYKAAQVLGIPCFNQTPVSEWLAEVDVKSETTSARMSCNHTRGVHRFTMITDPDVITQLTIVRNRMYS